MGADPDEGARARQTIDRIEALIHHDVGRGMNAIFERSAGGLWGAAAALAATPAPRIGLMTGFFIPGGQPPAAETDGPAGAALLARAFLGAGLTCRLATDTVCEKACRVALHAVGAGTIEVDSAAPGSTVTGLVDAWRQQGLDWVIAIERCGPAADGRYRNMRGLDIGSHVADLSRLFSAGPWNTIAIGDGGNEIGMGTLPRALIAAHVPMGEAIGCTVPADHLVTAGVSHWGAYALLGALSVLRPDWRTAIRAALDPECDLSVVTAMMRDGPAVDGVTLRQAPTIDGLDMETHHRKLAAVRAILSERGVSAVDVPSSEAE